MKFILTSHNSIDRARFPSTIAEWRSEGGAWLLHWNQMLFGVRVYLGPTGCSCGYDVIYCCGASVGEASLVTTAVIDTLKPLPESIGSAALRAMFPYQRVKPMHNDPECWEALCKLAGLPFFSLPVPNKDRT